MKAKSALIASISTVGIASMASAQTFTSAGGTFVSGGPHTVDLVVGASGTIADLDVSMNWASHAWMGDVEVTLTHVDTGTVAQIFGDVLGDGTPISNDSSNLVGVYRFDDESANSFDAAAAAVPSASPVAPGTYFPTNFGSLTNNNALSLFDGEDINGTWRLTIVDDVPAFSTGTLTNFSIHATIPAPGALGLLGAAGLAGLGRRRSRR